MVSLSNIHVIGSLYMSLHGGYKPCPDAFIRYFKRHSIKPKKVFFLGNRLVDLELADAISKRLKCKIFKCLIIRAGANSIAKKRADKIVRNLSQVREEINKFKPDLVLSDFDNTLFHSGYQSYESTFERLRFWERHAKSRLLRFFYSIGSQLSNPFIKRSPYVGKYDSTEGFIRTLKVNLIIHTMSSETIVWKYLHLLLD